MVVNFEFLDSEPIENMITCMNFKIDKVVFFGYHKVIAAKKDRTETLLKEYCGVETVVFHPLSQNDLQSTLKTMRKEVEYERRQKNQIYFDITGGESLILVAFGMLSKEFETPMHMFDVTANRLIELEEGAKSSIRRDVTARKTPMTIDLLIKMHGGQINTDLQTNIRRTDDAAFMEDAGKIYNVAKLYWTYWNPFSDFLKKVLVSEDPDSLEVSKTAYAVLDALQESKSSLKTPLMLNKLLDSLQEEGILMDVVHAEGRYGFRFKNKDVKDCLRDGGSVLELHTYVKESEISNECQVGVHLDWDGIIHHQTGEDVLNEIDVLSLRGNVPVFISCKSGKMDNDNVLYALYELETVTRRFGSKYAEKILVTVNDIGKVYKQRAAEMGIKIVVTK